MKKLGMSQAA
jgi:hypothetical protein